MAPVQGRGDVPDRFATEGLLVKGGGWMGRQRVEGRVERAQLGAGVVGPHLERCVAQHRNKASRQAGGRCNVRWQREQLAVAVPEGAPSAGGCLHHAQRQPHVPRLARLEARLADFFPQVACRLMHQVRLPHQPAHDARSVAGDQQLARHAQQRPAASHWLPRHQPGAALHTLQSHH
eukprot:scaffold1531_cov111-Isochrysis_galbana.AAC.9